MSERAHNPLLALRPACLAALACGVVCLLLATPAHAWVAETTSEGKPVRWQPSDIEFVLGGTTITSVSSSEFRAAAQNAVATWNWVDGNRLHMTLAPLADVSAWAGYNPIGANQNVVVFDYSLGPDDPLAVTTITFVPSTGELLDADIRVGPWGPWPSDEVARPFDLQSVLLHELGHCVGLGHVPDSALAVMSPSLAPGTRVRRQLTVDDISGLLSLYGPPKPQPIPEGMPVTRGATRPVPETGCRSSAIPAAGPGAAILLLALGALRRRPSSAALVALLAVAAPPGSADATTLIDVAPSTLVAESDAVVVAEALESESMWVDGRIITRVTLRVDECWTGDAPDEVVVEVPGGQVGDLAQIVLGAPRLEPGERYVLFVSDLDATPHVTRWALGAWRVRLDTLAPTVVRDVAGAEVVDLDGAPMVLDAMPLVELHVQVMTALPTPLPTVP